MRAKSAILLIMGLFLIGTATKAGASDKIDFLIKGAMGRPGGMGQAFVAVTDGPDSVYWNPAGLAFLNVIGGNIVHSSLGDYDMSTDMLSLAWPVQQNESGMGLALYRSSIGNIDLVDEVAGRPIVRGSFNENETAFIAGYGQKALDNLWLGATLKYMGMKLNTYSESGFGMDLGMLYKIDDSWTLGANFQNAIPVKLGSDRIPFNAKLGVAYKSPDERVIIASDIDTDVLGDQILHLGAEFWIVPQLALRLGSNDGKLTAGVGLARLATGWSFDYAYDDSDVGDTHRISIGFDFNPRQPKPKPVKKEKPAEVAKPAPAPKVDLPPAPKVEPVPAPKVETVPAPKPAEPVVAPKPTPAPEPEVKLEMIDAYAFHEGDGLLSLSNTELKAGQTVIIYKNKKKIAEATVTDVGMLSSSAKISTLFVEKLEDYMIGNKIAIK